MYAREDPTRSRGGTSPRPLLRQDSDSSSPGAASLLTFQTLAGNAAVTRSLSGQRGGGVPVQRAAAPVPVQRAGGYGEGTYGGRNRERRRLEDEWDEPIDGNSTHQAEHPILYSAAAPRVRTRVPRGQSGTAGANARHVENALPAYYEGYDDHRAHDGTGTRPLTRIGTTGMTQRQYRDSQTSALEDYNNPATAMHMNMIGYANQPGFRNPRRTPAVEQSDDSYTHMLQGRGSAPYFDANGQVRRTRPLMRYERAELHAGRQVARTGRYPDEQEQDALMRRYGARSYRLRSERTNDFDELTSYPDLGSDRSASPHELDTSYRQRSRSRRRSRSRPRLSQREQLNLLARGQTFDEDDFATSFGGGDYDEERVGRSRDRSRSRRRMASRSRTRAASTVPDISDAYSYGGFDEDEERVGRSRDRSRSRRRMASRSRTRPLSTVPDISDAYSYGGFDEDEERVGRSRDRSRSRRRMASRSRTRGASSRYPDVGDAYSYGDGDYYVR